MSCPSERCPKRRSASSYTNRHFLQSCGPSTPTVPTQPLSSSISPLHAGGSLSASWKNRLTVWRGTPYSCRDIAIFRTRFSTSDPAGPQGCFGSRQITSVSTLGHHTPGGSGFSRKRIELHCQSTRVLRFPNFCSALFKLPVPRGGETGWCSKRRVSTELIIPLLSRNSRRCSAMREEWEQEGRKIILNQIFMLLELENSVLNMTGEESEL